MLLSFAALDAMALSEAEGEQIRTFYARIWYHGN